MIVRFNTEALEEYRNAARYAEEHFGAGAKLVQAVRDALDEIAEDPGRYQMIGNEVRIYRLKRYPYYLFYRFDSGDETVTIYAVAHHKQRPGYWGDRLP